DVMDDGRQGLITHPNPRSPQHRTDYHPPYEEFRRRKARDSLFSAHAHVAEPCDFKKRLESLGITKTKDRGHKPCSLGTDVSLQPSSQGMRPGTTLNCAPHGGGEATVSNEHAVRLS